MIKSKHLLSLRAGPYFVTFNDSVGVVTLRYRCAASLPYIKTCATTMWRYHYSELQNRGLTTLFCNSCNDTVTFCYYLAFLLHTKPAQGQYNDIITSLLRSICTMCKTISATIHCNDIVTVVKSLYRIGLD